MLKDQTMQPTLLQEDFPCQPFSVAGKRKGTDDDRYLWDETIRVVAECKPSWFIGENVEGLININNGMVLRQVQTDLEDQGFQVQCIIVPAAGIGAFHQRKRIWIIGFNATNSNISSKTITIAI
jgi:DNA (cytosine-5)-methyltransferase 1